MPLYTFVCRRNHEFDSVVPVGTRTRTCQCGLPAQKLSVYAIAQKQPETRFEGRDFIEASAQVEHNFAEFERREGTQVERPSFWGAAKARAARMMDRRSGE